MRAKRKRKANAPQGLVEEIETLRARLGEAEETLRAIRSGEVDALVVSGPDGEQVFTLQGAEHPYRIFIENIQEGAASVDNSGTILFANRRFSEILATPLDDILGSNIKKFISPFEKAEWDNFFLEARAQPVTREFQLSLNRHPVDLESNRTRLLEVTWNDLESTPKGPFLWRRQIPGFEPPGVWR